jgi:HK97 family phage prohead protease
MSVQIERRYVSVDSPSAEQASHPLRIERRAADQGSSEDLWLVGYGAVFNSDSVEMDDFIEQISPEAFRVVQERRGRKRALQTRGLYNHDPNYVLGRYPDTLKLSVDEVGLRYELLLPKARHDIAELVERGDIRGSSFSFTIADGGEQWSKRDDGRHIRTVTAIDDLFDVGPVTFPAYTGTEGLEVAKRSLQQFVSASVAQKAREQAILKQARQLARSTTFKMLGQIEDARKVLQKYGHKSR